MTTRTAHHAGEHHPEHHHERIVVTVNNQPVAFDQRRVTGAQIKHAAIAQGVSIQPDFALFEVGRGPALQQIPDGEMVELYPHEAFRTLAPDDNS
jgi:hypothetical protein